MSRLTMKRKYGEALTMTTKDAEKLHIKIHRIGDSVSVGLDLPATVEVLGIDYRRVERRLAVECKYGEVLTLTTLSLERIHVKIHRIRQSIVMVTLDLPATVEVVRDNAKKTERPQGFANPSAA